MFLLQKLSLQLTLVAKNECYNLKAKSMDGGKRQKVTPPPGIEPGSSG